MAPSQILLHILMEGVNIYILTPLLHYCPEDRKPVGNNKNSIKNHPCAYVVYIYTTMVDDIEILGLLNMILKLKVNVKYTYNMSYSL